MPGRRRTIGHGDMILREAQFREPAMSILFGTARVGTVTLFPVDGDPMDEIEDSTDEIGAEIGDQTDEIEGALEICIEGSIRTGVWMLLEIDSHQNTELIPSSTKMEIE
jgi:hypothetical protein